MRQSVRDVMTSDISLEYFAKRFREGWRIASISWVRESGEEETSAPNAGLLSEDAAVPYGLQVSEDGLMRENSVEAAVLLLILDQIIREKRVTEIADELNRHGYSTRKGMRWSASDVFCLMPRLIEAGPSLLKSSVWQQMRPVTQPAKKAN